MLGFLMAQWNVGGFAPTYLYDMSSGVFRHQVDDLVLHGPAALETEKSAQLYFPVSGKLFGSSSTSFLDEFRLGITNHKLLPFFKPMNTLFYFRNSISNDNPRTQNITYTYQDPDFDGTLELKQTNSVTQDPSGVFFNYNRGNLFANLFTVNDPFLTGQIVESANYFNVGNTFRYERGLAFYNSFSLGRLKAGLLLEYLPSGNTGYELTENETKDVEADVVTYTESSEYDYSKFSPNLVVGLEGGSAISFGRLLLRIWLEKQGESWDYAYSYSLNNAPHVAAKDEISETYSEKGFFTGYLSDVNAVTIYDEAPGIKIGSIFGVYRPEKIKSWVYLAPVFYIPLSSFERNWEYIEYDSAGNVSNMPAVAWWPAPLYYEKIKRNVSGSLKGVGFEISASVGSRITIYRTGQIEIGSLTEFDPSYFVGDFSEELSESGSFECDTDGDMAVADAATDWYGTISQKRKTSFWATQFSFPLIQALALSWSPWKWFSFVSSLSLIFDVQFLKYKNILEEYAPFYIKYENGDKSTREDYVIETTWTDEGAANYIFGLNYGVLFNWGIVLKPVSNLWVEMRVAIPFDNVLNPENYNFAVIYSF